MHQGLGAMMTGAHGYAEFVKQKPYVIVMLIPDKEGYDGSLSGSSAEDTHTRHFVNHPAGGVFEKLLFMGRNPAKTDTGYIVKRRIQCSDAYIVGRTCLKLERQCSKVT